VAIRSWWTLESRLIAHENKNPGLQGSDILRGPAQLKRFPGRASVASVRLPGKARQTPSPQIPDSPAGFLESCRGYAANVGAAARVGTEPQSAAFGYGHVGVRERRATRRTDEKGPGGSKEWKFHCDMQEMFQRPAYVRERKW
jgi:hypothetical protein